MQSAPVNRAHVSSYVPLLLRIPLGSLDSLQVGQQQATLFQHLTDIVLATKQNVYAVQRMGGM